MNAAALISRLSPAQMPRTIGSMMKLATSSPNRLKKMTHVKLHTKTTYPFELKFQFHGEYF